MIKVIYILIFISHIGLSLQGQPSSEYISRLEEVSKIVWGEDREEFKIDTVPGEYKNRSKVVIAKRNEIHGIEGKKEDFKGTEGGSKNYFFSEISHERIWINDESSADDYSEFKFKLYYKNKGQNAFEKVTTYIGIKIIKPDGRIIISDPEEIILTVDDINFKEAKIAVTELKPGDIVDYFVAAETYASNDFRPKSFDIALFNDDPVLNISFFGLLDAPFAANHRNYNGAPILSINTGKKTVIDLKMSDIPPSEIELWTIPALQLPFIRLFIAYGYNGAESRYIQSFKTGDIKHNPPVKPVLRNFSDDLLNDYNSTCTSFNPIFSYCLSSNGLEKSAFLSEMSMKEKALKIFYLVRFAKLLDFDIDRLSERMNIGSQSYNGMCSELICILKKMADEDSEVLI
jgi:hypothetical protein